MNPVKIDVLRGQVGVKEGGIFCAVSDLFHTFVCLDTTKMNNYAQLLSCQSALAVGYKSKMAALYMVCMAF